MHPLPTLGRTVHYVLPDSSSDAGSHRVAFVVRVENKPEGVCDLHVLKAGLDDFNDENGDDIEDDCVVENVELAALLRDVPFSAEHETGSWHWPERE